MSDNITSIPFTRNPVVTCKKMPPDPKNNWIKKLSGLDEHTKECNMYKDEAKVDHTIEERETSTKLVYEDARAYVVADNDKRDITDQRSVATLSMNGIDDVHSRDKF
jgi:hypothetical protein